MVVAQQLRMVAQRAFADDPSAGIADTVATVAAIVESETETDYVLVAADSSTAVAVESLFANSPVPAVASAESRME